MWVPCQRCIAGRIVRLCFMARRATDFASVRHRAAINAGAFASRPLKLPFFRNWDQLTC